MPLYKIVVKGIPEERQFSINANHCAYTRL